MIHEVRIVLSTVKSIWMNSSKLGQLTGQELI